MDNKLTLTLKLTLIGCALLSNAMAHEFKSGMYIGPQIGVGFQHTNFDVDFKIAPTANPLEKTRDKHSINFLYGSIFGYRYIYSSNFVLGFNFDADFNHKNVKCTFDFSETNARIINQQLKKKHSFVPSLSLGHIINPKWMVFTQLGLLVSKYELKSAYPSGPTMHKKNKTLTGFVAGLGTEHALNKSWSLRCSINYEISKTLRVKFKNIQNSTADDFESSRIENKAAVLKLAAIYKI